MRLIDADAFLNFIKNLSKDEDGQSKTYSEADICSFIKNQPTAYDIEKLAKRLEQEGDNIFATHFPEEEQEFTDNGIAKGFWASAKIVKSGQASDR